MKPTRLIIVRHGNTFLPEETPRRVGGLTDLPLVPSGEAQARLLGEHFKALGILPAVIYTGPLLRTRQTAKIMAEAAGWGTAIEIEPCLRELDYGPDENQPEPAVIKRIGTAALEAWEKQARVPAGWKVDMGGLLKSWELIGEQTLEHYEGQTVIVVTSNGIARFAAALVGGLEAFGARYGFKLATGAYGVFEETQTGWEVCEWNTRP
ncbi:MAG TPA: histidine phosphatase family protein [Opitutales bacterium]|nr:histidine phosphatase family protein [Opitutales bacterium]